MAKVTNSSVVIKLTSQQMRRALLARREQKERQKLKKFIFDPDTMEKGRNLCLLGPPIPIGATPQCRHLTHSLLKESDGLVCRLNHISDPTRSVKSAAGELVGYRQLRSITTIDTYGEICGDDGNYYQGFELQEILKSADMVFSILQVKKILKNHTHFKTVLNMVGGPNIFPVYDQKKVYMLAARMSGKLWYLTDSMIGPGRGFGETAHFIVKNKWPDDAVVGEK